MRFFLCLYVLVTCLMLAPVQAASFTVNSTADTVDDDLLDDLCIDASGNCTLRAAIQQSNDLPGADIITLPAGTFNFVLAGTGEESAATGDLDINDSLTITGAGVHLTFVDGQDLDRVFDVGPITTTITVTLSNMVIRNGNITGSNGGLIQNAGTLTLSEISLENGQAAFGGGLYTASDLTVNRSLLKDNTASTDGGGFFQGGGVSSFTNSTFSGNTATVNGGGLYLATGVTTTLDFATVAFNTAVASGGGGLYNAGTLTINSTIISDNTSENCAGAVATTTDGSSLDSGNTCGLDVINTSPSLSALQDNGGETATHALAAGSPAIDTASATCPGVDQRNVARPVDGDNSMTAECDIGAYEWTPAIDLQVSNSHVKDCVKKGKDVTYLIGVTNIGGGDASSVVLTDTLPGSSIFVSADGGCTHSAGVVTCTIGVLAAGASQNFTIVVNAPVTDYLANVVSVTAAEQDDNLANNSAEEFTRINCSACFIATAAYGSSWTAEVMSLRLFRDQFLLKNETGRKLVLFYYKHSPVIAENIRNSTVLRTLTRVSLAPFVLVSKLLTNTQ